MDSARVAAIPMFADLPDAELAAVARVAYAIEVPAGRPLAREREFGHELLAIESGTANIVMGDEIVRTVGPGDVLGEIAVLHSGRRTASIVATSPVRGFGVFKRDVWALSREAPVAAQRLRAALEEHLAQDEARRRAAPDPPPAAV